MEKLRASKRKYYTDQELADLWELPSDKEDDINMSDEEMDDSDADSTY